MHEPASKKLVPQARTHLRASALQAVRPGARALIANPRRMLGRRGALVGAGAVKRVPEKVQQDRFPARRRRFGTRRRRCSIRHTHWLRRGRSWVTGAGTHVAGRRGPARGARTARPRRTRTASRRTRSASARGTNPAARPPPARPGSGCAAPARPPPARRAPGRDVCARRAPCDGPRGALPWAASPACRAAAGGSRAGRAYEAGRARARLRVLVNEEQGVGHVVVAQVDDRAADPLAQLLRAHATCGVSCCPEQGTGAAGNAAGAPSGARPLAARQDGMHGARHRGRLLHTVQALPRVGQPVRVALRQQVLLRQAPQLEHLRGVCARAHVTLALTLAPAASTAARPPRSLPAPAPHAPAACMPAAQRRPRAASSAPRG